MSESSTILIENECGRVEIKPMYDGGPLSTVITITSAPEDVVAALRTKKINLPKRVYAYRNVTVPGGELQPEPNFEFGNHVRVRIAGRPGLAALWHAAQNWDADNRRRKEQEKQAAREAFIAACPAGHVLVKPVSSMPDPWEAGMSITIWADDRGRRFEGTPEGPIHDGCLAYISDARLDVVSEAFAQREKADAQRQADADAKKKAERDAEEARFRKIAELAKSTGTEQVVRSWVTSRCMNGNDDECSFDRATTIVRPDGSMRTVYVCCF